jgi:hypothetical protein
LSTKRYLLCRRRIPRRAGPAGELPVRPLRVGGSAARAWSSSDVLTWQRANECTLGPEPIGQSGRDSAFHGEGRIDVGMLFGRRSPQTANLLTGGVSMALKRCIVQPMHAEPLPSFAGMKERCG